MATPILVAAMAWGVAAVLATYALPGQAQQSAAAPAAAGGASAASPPAGPAGAGAAPASSAPAGSTPAGSTPAVNAREQQLLERIRQLKSPRWRTYGACRYDWGAWRLAEGNVRTTDAECGPDNARALVAVHCETLQVSRREGESGWSPWRLPLSASESKASGGEDLMVAALCANIRPAAQGSAAQGSAAPAPMGTAGSPASKPAARPTPTKPAATGTGNR